MIHRALGALSRLNDLGAEYVVIGGVAAIVHGVPRTTFDVDLLIRRTRENAERVLQALAESGLGTATLVTADEILAHENTQFRDRVSFDILLSAPGIDVERALADRMAIEYQGVRFWVLSREDLIASKLASGRPHDPEDARALEILSTRAGGSTSLLCRQES